MMSTEKIIGWTVTALMAGFMLLSAIPDLLRVPAALGIMKHLGYPPYLLLFLGTAKTMGVLAVLVPGIPRIKEWAFAGLMFDVSGALYSHLSVGDSPAGWGPAAVGLLLVSGSYLAYRMRVTRSAQTNNGVAGSGQRGSLGATLQSTT
jgi:uncharacterized membrane protein YphA (DoxX/SURF4 family)